MHTPFFGRRFELEKGHLRLSNKKFDFIIVYGRRRVGKTRYVLELVKDRKYIYNMGVNSSAHANLNTFSRSCAGVIEGITDLREDYDVLFKAIKNRVEVLILDEYPLMIKKDKLLSSRLQYFIDHEYKDTSMVLILLGSSISMMKNIMGEPSALFGRRTSTIKLAPMEFYELQHFFPTASFEELVEIYGMTDGIPKYLEEITLPFWDWLSDELYYQNILADEVYTTLNTEFREPAKYFEILDAIAVGKRKYGEIANFCGMKVTDLSAYMKKLLYAEIVYQEYPINETVRSPATTHRAVLKKGHYYLNDNFLKFWFRFIYSHFGIFSERKLTIEIIKTGYSQYLGIIFEDISRQLVKTHFNFDYIGRWWGKVGTVEREIDILAFNQADDKALIGECKWRDKINPKGIMKDLVALESQIVYRHKRDPKDYSYAIFAKSFTKKIKSFRLNSGPDSKQRTVNCYDLEDLTKMIKKMT